MLFISYAPAWTSTRGFSTVVGMPVPARTHAADHASGPRVHAQVEYLHKRTVVRTTASLLLARKCRNCAAVLKNALPYQRRYPARAQILEASIRMLEQSAERFITYPPSTPSRLFLLEAHATRAYWRGVRVLLARHDPSWKRRYPHAHDPVNILLNIGYTFLARWLHAEIQRVGLLPEIGMLHATRKGKDPLAYDLMELFRQPAVDAVVIPLFTKKKRPVKQATERDMRRAVAAFHTQWERPFGTAERVGRCGRLFSKSCSPSLVYL